MTFDELDSRVKTYATRPLVVAYGLGVDSTAAIIALARRYKAGQKSARPDLILFADTGGERPETYAYLPIFQEYLKSVGFPPVVTVKYRPKHGKYTTLEENCLVNKTLPSLAFGYKKCSLKWKRQPQDTYVKTFPQAQLAWSLGWTVIKVIGYDAGPKDARRSEITDDRYYHYWYPLREMGWDRERCIAEIIAEGLPAPPKSACFFCPSAKPNEIHDLAVKHPDYGRRIARMEGNAMPYLTQIEGLWRKGTKSRPGSMTEFLVREGFQTGPAQFGCLGCGG